MNRTKNEVELALDEFSLEEVERAAERLGVPRGRVVQRAVRHWLDQHSTGRIATRPLACGPQASPHPTVALAVDLAPSDWDAVQRAAQSYETEPKRLIEHAVLLLLADVHAGRLAAAIARSTNGMKP
jgi:hypothetical protein